MKRSKWFSHPIGSLALLFVWLLLVDDFTSLGHWLLGGCLGLLIPRLTVTWWPRLPRIKSWKHALIFTRHMVTDIVIANFQVARLALGPMHQLQPCRVAVPHNLEHELAIYLLASAISLAPGTVSVDIDRDAGVLIIHALHTVDEHGLIAEIKQRYEQPLQEAFACSI